MSIPQSFIQELLTRVDIVDVVGRYVQLKKGGANFMGLCPFHGEKSPSFSVSPTKQFFHCFGCGKSGDAIAFLMEHTGVTFVEAVEDLAQQNGLQVPEDDASPEERARAAEQKQKQHTLTDVLEQAATAYKKNLKASPRAIAYLKGRGVSGEIAKVFGLGYAPEGWRSLASVFPKYDDPLLEESGLVIAGDEDKRYDRLRDRVVFPIRNIKGECIGFGGRVLGDEKPKYLNSPETPVFSKGRELYGLFEARQSIHDRGYVLVTEGYMDVVALAQLGFPNAVATLGTACTPDHVQKLFRFTDSVVFSFDGDSAGRRAARKALDGALSYATDVRSVKFLFLPAEHDPDSYVREFGEEGFSKAIADATPLSRFLIEAAKEGCDLKTAEGRAHMASNARPMWGLLPEGALKRQLLSEIASQIELPVAEVEALWNPAPKNSYQRRGEQRDGAYQSFSSRDGESGGYGSNYGSGGSGASGGAGNRQWNKFKKKDGSPEFERSSYRAAGRTMPTSRIDHAARLLLIGSHSWDRLSGEDHAMLCALPAPHGPLFVWLESQLHEHGPVTWSALAEMLKGHELESAATRLVNALPVNPNAAESPEESREQLRELRSVLDRMLIELLKQQETEAIREASEDPAALVRYRELQSRRRELELSGKNSGE